MACRFRDVAPDEALEMEPGLKLPVVKAVHFHEARHLRDVQAFITRMHDAFVALGGTSVRAPVEGLVPLPDGVELQADGQTFTAGHAVISGGAFSGE